MTSSTYTASLCGSFRLTIVGALVIGSADPPPSTPASLGTRHDQNGRYSTNQERESTRFRHRTAAQSAASARAAGCRVMNDHRVRGVIRGPVREIGVGKVAESSARVRG